MLEALKIVDDGRRVRETKCRVAASAAPCGGDDDTTAPGAHNWTLYAEGAQVDLRGQPMGLLCDARGAVNVPERLPEPASMLDSIRLAGWAGDVRRELAQRLSAQNKKGRVSLVVVDDADQY